MKVKVIDQIQKERVLDIEYPFYLYYQDEFCINDELVKVDDVWSIVVKLGLTDCSVEKVKTKVYSENEITNNLTTRKCFDSVFIEAIEAIEKEFK